MKSVEFIGLCASVLVLISFTMRRILAIRIINIGACITFVVYGLLIGALSVWLLNGLLIFVHIYYLVHGAQSKKTKKASKFRKNMFNSTKLRKQLWLYDWER